MNVASHRIALGCAIAVCVSLLAACPPTSATGTADGGHPPPKSNPGTDSGTPVVDAGSQEMPPEDAGMQQTEDAGMTQTDAGMPPNMEPFPDMGNATAVTTFQSIGLYWKAPGGSSSVKAKVQFRKQGAYTWRDGLDLWFDDRNSEYRGSIVLLEPGNAYQVRLQLEGTQTIAQLTPQTWSENFPIGKTVTLPANSTSELDITTGGTSSGYVLYAPAQGTVATIDLNDNADFCVRISAPYVIVHGVNCKGPARDGFRIETGAHDVVIEDSEASNWGRVRDTSTGWGVNGDSAVHVAYKATGVNRIVIQRNNFHDPRWDSNSWAVAHPAGPNGIYFENCSLPDDFNCGSNHVIRYNIVHGNPTHHFMDGIGGEDNFSATGAPNADTDNYGNDIRYCWDDGIESEGADRNVRIWGNYITETFTGIASATDNDGPLYIFRNIYDVSRQTTNGNDVDEHGPFGKLGDGQGYGGGRRYYFHNTLLQQPPPSGQQYPQGAGNGPLGGYGERPMVQTVSRNNIWHTWKSSWEAAYGNSSSMDNDFDYDLENGVVNIGGTNNKIGMHNVKGVPTFAPGNGEASKDGGKYELAAGTLGVDQGEVIPNFNDGFTGAAPDIGAFETGQAPMKFGPAGYSPGTPPPPPPPPPPVTLPWAVNAGGNATGSFMADANFSGGSTALNWTGAIDTTGVTSPAPDDVYRAERYGDSTYTLAGLTAGKTYRVRLHFAENYHTAAGQRSFDVTINGTKVLAALDVFAEAGAAHKAVIKEFTPAADAQGRLVISFTTVTENALVNGIEVLAQ